MNEPTEKKRPVTCPVCQRKLVQVARSIEVFHGTRQSTVVRRGMACQFCKVVVQLDVLYPPWKTE